MHGYGGSGARTKGTHDSLCTHVHREDVLFVCLHTERTRFVCNRAGRLRAFVLHQCILDSEGPGTIPSLLEVNARHAFSEHALEFVGLLFMCFLNVDVEKSSLLSF